MIIFRRRGTAQLSPAFGVFAIAFGNFGAFTDTTEYWIIGPFRDPGARVEFSEPNAQVTFSDPGPRVVISEPEVTS